MALSDALESGVATFRTLAARAGHVGRQLQSFLPPVLRRRNAPAWSPAITEPSAAEGTHARIARAKFDLGSPAVRVGGEPGDLPRAYGRDRVVLLPRDPWWIFAYWEITPATRDEALRAFGVEATGAQMILRVHDLTASADTAEGDVPSIDVEVPSATGGRYVDVGRPGITSYAELGLRTPAGRFVPLVRSNTLHVPPSQASPDATVSWLPLRTPSGRIAATRPQGSAAATPPGSATSPTLRSGDAGVRH